MNIFRKWFLNKIADAMSHENYALRAQVFAAINEGMAKEFSEDNYVTRLSYTVELLVRNGKEFHPYPFLGQTYYPDVSNMALVAADGVLAACATDKKPLYKS